MDGDLKMRQAVIDTNTLQLPQEFADLIGSDLVLIREVDEGVLLTPAPKQSRRLRGMLKGTGFSTERYFAQKQADKELEG